jgi:hypothetical protein
MRIAQVVAPLNLAKIKQGSLTHSREVIVYGDIDATNVNVVSIEVRSDEDAKFELVESLFLKDSLF